MRTIILVVISAICFAGYASAYDIDRGIKNYQAIMAGTKSFNQLSAEEKSEVVAVYQAMRGDDNGSSQCRDATNRASSAASELAGYAKRLQVCAEAENYSDDCSSEFRRVKNSQSDYESASSDVGYACD